MEIKVFRDEKGYVRATTEVDGHQLWGSAETVSGALRNLAFEIQTRKIDEAMQIKFMRG